MRAEGGPGWAASRTSLVPRLRAPSARGWWGLGTRLRPFSRDPRAWAERSLTSGPYLIFV